MNADSYPAYRVDHFGDEGEPVVIIDDFSADPQALIALAAAQEFTSRGQHYPGVRAQADASYLGQQADLLQDILIHIFGMAEGARLVECNYSIVTTAPDQLTPIQRLPHFDSTDPGRLALLHYLSGPEQGGTAWYRHRQTGYERITQDRLAKYSAILEAEMRAEGLPDSGYVRGDTQHFERTGVVEAKFNRMLIYRGLRLHSGDIPPDLPRSVIPSIGRLTINTFLQARS